MASSDSVVPYTQKVLVVEVVEPARVKVTVSVPTT
jgi:hypothetical protein